MDEFLKTLGMLFGAFILITWIIMILNGMENLSLSEAKWRCTEINKGGKGECVNYRFVGGNQ